MRYAIGHLISGRGHQPHLDNSQVNQMVIDFFDTNLIPQEQMLAFFGERGETLQRAEMVLEQYQGPPSAFVTDEIEVETVAAEPPPPPEPLSLEEKKSLLMKRFESQLDDLLTWHTGTPGSTKEQFDQALNDLQAQMDRDISTMLLDEGGDSGKKVEE